MQDLSKIKIIFSDIDGTLLPFTGKDLAPTAALLHELMEAGYLFVPCPGRGTGSIPPELMRLPGLRYAIPANGALITDLSHGRVIWDKTVPRAVAEPLTRFLRHYYGNSYLYRHGEHYLDIAFGHKPYDRSNKSLVAWMESVHKVDFLEFLKEEESATVDKFGFASPDPKVFDAIRADIRKEDFYDKLLISTSGDWNIEINAAGASKGDAALWLAKELGFGPENMLCAGDNMNDMSMLTGVGISVAPENALPAVKAAVTCVVPDCRENGVENFFRQLLS